MDLLERINKYLLIIRYKLSTIMDEGNSELYKRILQLRGVTIGSNVLFRQPKYTEIDVTRPYLINIGENVDINKGFTLLTHDFGTFVFKNLYKDFVNSSGKVEIGNNVVIGQNVTLLKGVSIGDNCIIGLGSVVSKSIPSNSVAVGCPAKVICSIEEYYKKRKEKSIDEAIDCGVELYKKKRDSLTIEDFAEEWCLFVKKNEYQNIGYLKNAIDWRLKDNVEAFLDKPKAFSGYESFITAVKERYYSEASSK